MTQDQKWDASAPWRDSLFFDPLWRLENSKACLNSQLRLFGVLLINASPFCL